MTHRMDHDIGGLFRWERRQRKQHAAQRRIQQHGRMTPILNAIRKAAKRAGPAGGAPENSAGRRGAQST